MADPPGTIRLDKWLWYARFFKTRGLAARTVSAGQVRVNGERATRPSRTVGSGDVLTFAQGRRIRVVRIEAPGTRRGPASEAQTLYTDMDPPASEAGEDSGPGELRRQGRPDRAERRRAILSKRHPLE